MSTAEDGAEATITGLAGRAALPVAPSRRPPTALIAHVTCAGCRR